MRILQERVDNEEYLELSISESEFSMIKEFMIISKRCLLNNKLTNIGIKLELGENSDEEEDQQDLEFHFQK